MSAYSDAVKALGPSLFWALDAATKAEDLSGNARNGTGVGSISLGGLGDSPIIGQAHSTDFSGSGQYIDSTYKPFTNGTKRSIGVWVWRDTSNGRDALWGSDSSPFTSCEIGGPDAGKDDGAVFSPNWGTNKSIWGAGTFPGKEQWVFVGLTFDESGDVAELFIDGVSKGTKANAGAYTNGKNLRLGAWFVGSGVEFDGKMAGFFVVERLVSAEEWEALFVVATAEAPLAATGEAADVTHAAATLNGTVDPNGAATTYYFEYGETESYGTKIPAAEDGEAGEGEAPVAVAEVIEGLDPETAYHYRLVAANALGASFGDDETFQTEAAPVVLPDPTAFKPEVKPPLGLDVEIELANGDTFTHHCDDQRPRMRPFDQSFGTARGDGFTTGSFGLHRPVLRDYQDVNLMDTQRFIGKDGSIAYEGRLHSNPRTNDPAEQLEMNLVGWATYLRRGRRCAALIIDRRLSGWGDPSMQRRADLVAVANAPDYFPASFGHQDTGAAGAGISFAIARLVGGITERGEQWFHAGGEDIGEVRYDFAGHGEDPDWFDRMDLSATDLGAGGDAGSDHNGHPSQVNAAVIASGPGRKYAFCCTAYGGAAVVDPFIASHRWTNIRVFGTHGLTRRGGAPDEGFWITDIERYLIERYRPKIKWAPTNPDNTYPVGQVAWHDGPVDVHTAIQQMNDLALWETNVWEHREFHTHPADLTRYDWLIRTTDPGVKVLFQGDSIETFANGIEVTYTDFAGVQRTLYPTDHVELRDEREDNPANRQGEELWTHVDVPRPCVQVEALQYARAYLGEFNRPKRPGSYRILSGHIRDSAYHWHEGWRTRNGQTLGILDHPDDNPRLIVDTRWNPDNSLTITVDAPPKMLDAIVARHQRAREGANLT
jgi:hypothetical protein